MFYGPAENRGLLRLEILFAATAATAGITATAVAVARKKKRRDDDYPDKAFVIKKIANAVHKNFLPIKLKSKKINR